MATCTYASTDLLSQSYNQIHKNGNPLHSCLVILLDIGQNNGNQTSFNSNNLAPTGMVVPMEEYDRFPLQKYDISIDELVILEKIINVVEQMEIWVGMGFYNVNSGDEGKSLPAEQIEWKKPFWRISCKMKQPMPIAKIADMVKRNRL